MLFEAECFVMVWDQDDSHLEGVVNTGFFYLSLIKKGNLQ